MSSLRSAAPKLLAGSFFLSGTIHMVRPQFFDSIMPRAIAKELHRPLIYLSGLAELLCGWGLIRSKKWAGTASVGLLAAILPANLQMALDAGTGRNEGVADNKLAAWGRLPLQLAMIWAARQSGH